MLVIANPDKLGLGNVSMSYTDLVGKIGSYNVSDVAKGNFVMTNSSWISSSETENKKVYLATEIKAENISESTSVADSRATAKPVDVYLERVVAKVRADYDWTKKNDEGFLVEDVTISGETGTYTAVKLYSKSAEGTETPITAGGKQLYVIFKGWNVDNTASQSYLFKHLPLAATSWNLDWNWSIFDNHRSFWAINPTNAFGEQKSALAYNDINKSFGGDTNIYVQENAGDDEATGEKTSNATTALFAGVLVTLGGKDNNVATPVTLVRYGDNLLLGEDVIKQVYNAMGAEDNGNGWAWIKDEENNKFTNDILKYLEFKDVDGKKYVQLKSGDGVTLPTFYKGITEGVTDETDLTEYKPTDINTALTLKGKGEIKNIYNDGMTYYTIKIQHLGTEKTEGDATKNFGKYGIVRNHVYDIKLKTVYGPGNAVFDPTEHSIGYVVHEFSLNAVINVLSWRIVTNDANLDWGTANRSGN